MVAPPRSDGGLQFQRPGKIVGQSWHLGGLADTCASVDDYPHNKPWGCGLGFSVLVVEGQVFCPLPWGRYFWCIKRVWARAAMNAQINVGYAQVSLRLSSRQNMDNYHVAQGHRRSHAHAASSGDAAPLGVCD